MRSAIFGVAFLLILLVPFSAGAAEQVVIRSAAELAAFRDRVNGGETELDAKLAADIDLSELPGPWAPIGAQVVEGAPGSYRLVKDCAYGGTFDGNYKTVRGLKVTSDSAVRAFLDEAVAPKAAGLFGVTARGMLVRHLTIEGAAIDLPGDVDASAGAIAGVNQGDIAMCAVDGGTVRGSRYAGGAAGCNLGELVKVFVEEVALVEGKTAGGVVGWNGMMMTDCYTENAGTVSGDVAGGVAGASNGALTCSRARKAGRIEGRIAAGGIAGVNVGELTRSYLHDAAGVFGGAAGGVAGINHEVGTIARCYTISDAAKLTISASGAQGCAGAIVGEQGGGASHSGQIEDCGYSQKGIAIARREFRTIGNVPPAQIDKTGKILPEDAAELLESLEPSYW